MGSDDTKPQSLMSRNKGDNKVITGGRSIKHWPKTSWRSSGTATWLSNPDKALNPPHPSADESPPKAKKQMFRHVPRHSHDHPKPLPDAATAVDDALDESFPKHHRHTHPSPVKPFTESSFPPVPLAPPIQFSSSSSC